MAAAAAWLPVAALATWAGANLQLTVWIASSLSLLLLTAVVTHREGFSVEAATHRYRHYTWVAGLRFGKWQALPFIAHIVVRHTKYKHYFPVTEHHDPVTLGFSATERQWQVLLSIVGQPIGITAAWTDYQQAARIATELSTLLGVECKML